MPTYTFYIISNSVLSYDSVDNEFDFDASYNYAEDRYRVVVNDDDSIMDGGGDANQTAMIYDMDDNLIDSGPIAVPQYATINMPGGGVSYLDRVEVDGVHYGYLPSTTLTPGTSYEVDSAGTDNLGHTYYETNSVPCFASGTLIATRDGEMPVQWITQGSEVLTLDHGYQPVVWAGRWRVPWATLNRSKRHWPVTLPADPASGARALVVSAAHQMMLRDPWFELACGSSEVLCRSGLIAPAAPPAQGKSLIWHHLLLPDHEVIRANGHWTESLFAGGHVFADLPKAQQVQVLACSKGAHTRTARPILRGYEAGAYFNSTAKWSGYAKAQRRNNRVA